MAAFAESVNEEELRKAIRMKTSRQLKAVFEDLEVPIPEGTSKEELRQIAFETPIIVEHMKEQVIKKKLRKQREASSKKYGNMKIPEGMDPEEWAKLMAQMHGDFSFEPDPEKRAILERLKAGGINFGGAHSMDLEALRNLEKAMKSGGFSPPSEADNTAEDDGVANNADEINLDAKKDEL
eukprot:jgi/Bigna1/87495/estExt_fgenesh1_pg.C_210027